MANKFWLLNFVSQNVAIFLLYANSAVNPAIYSFFNENFRDSFSYILNKFCSCSATSNQSVLVETYDATPKRLNSKNLTKNDAKILSWLPVTQEINCVRKKSYQMMGNKNKNKNKKTHAM